MNERLERLAFKVMDEPVDLERTHLKIDVVRFAELIIRECADYVDSAISDGGVDGRVLKEHFGVK